MRMHQLPILGICAAGSNAGKTTLITQLIPELKKHGIRVSVIKHAHHKFDIDHPGKDSYQIREAGAKQTLIASSKRWALMTEHDDAPEGNNQIDLNTLTQQIDETTADLIIVEGFKAENIQKIEVHRPSLAMPLLAKTDPNIIAVASDATIEANVPVLALDNIVQITKFVIDQFNLQASKP